MNSEFDLEFRSVVDEAWYNALAILNNDTLTMKLEGFPDCDEVFDASKFETVEKVDEFMKRFRPISVQVQDDNCSLVSIGKTFCATLVSGHYDVRYYDVTVTDVCVKEHVINEKEEDVCKCEFRLCWQHGVKMGTTTINHGVEGICEIQSWLKIDPRVATFCKTVKNQIRKKMNLPQVKLESTGSLQDCKEEGNAQRPTTGDHDRDVGGCFDSASTKETGNQYFTIIENVEKDISPSDITGYIKKNTRVTAKSFVDPSVFSESYNRAVVFSDRKEEIDKIFKFLSSSDHIIMSSKGRPWLIYEKKVRRGTILPTSAKWNLESRECEKFKSILKVVKRGEIEFEMGVKLQNILRGFLDHQRQLYASLEARMVYASAR